MLYKEETDIYMHQTHKYTNYIQICVCVRVCVCAGLLLNVICDVNIVL